uniref:zinc finger protein 37 n=1 Tax=Doryrhamphus excisus TaxID=161450 RepID=UPI0025AE9E82|nr:zinc finger protein 37 [Doryrhamphus excisus]
MSDMDTLVVTFHTQLLDVMETVVKTAMYKVTQLVEDSFLEEVKRKNQEVETLRIKLQFAERKLSVKEGGVCVDIASNDTGDASADRLEDLQDDVLMDCSVKRERDGAERSLGTQRCEMQSDEAPSVLSPEEDTHTTEDDVIPVVKKEVGPEDVRASPKHLSLEMDAAWTGQTLHHQRLGGDREGDPNTAQLSPQRADQEDCFPDGNMSPATRHQLCSSSSKGRLQNLASLAVPIKQEIIVDSHEAEGIRHVKKEATTKSGITSASCAIKRNSLSSLAPKHNTNSHKPTAQEGIKVNSKDATCDRLQAAMKHLIRSVKKPTPALSNNTAAASQSYSQALNLDPLNRIPTTSKAIPPAAIPRNQPANKLTFSRTGPPCATSHHAHSSSHPEGVLRHPLRCGHCDKCFPHLSNLKTHLQTHTGERPFCCSLCGRSFTKLSNLKAHRRVHTGERPYCCLACGKRFTQKCNLKRHQRIHMDD